MSFFFKHLCWQLAFQLLAKFHFIFANTSKRVMCKLAAGHLIWHTDHLQVLINLATNFRGARGVFGSLLRGWSVVSQRKLKTLL